MTQEIGKVETVDGSILDFSQHPIGSFLRLVPYHVSNDYCNGDGYGDGGRDVIDDDRGDGR